MHWIRLINLKPLKRVFVGLMVCVVCPGAAFISTLALTGDKDSALKAMGYTLWGGIFTPITWWGVKRALRSKEEVVQQLGSRGLKAKRQWEQARPQMCKELKEKGQFYQALQQAEDRALRVYQKALKNRATYQQAEELANKELFLPKESQLPTDSRYPA